MTRDQIKAMLRDSDRAVERAILALYKRQTQDEQASSCTQHTNGQGFNAFDAPSGTYYAKWILKGRKLTGRHLVNARKMAVRYVGQLSDIAAENTAATKLTPPSFPLQKGDMVQLFVPPTDLEEQADAGLSALIASTDPFNDPSAWFV